MQQRVERVLIYLDARFNMSVIAYPGRLHSDGVLFMDF